MTQPSLSKAIHAWKLKQQRPSGFSCLEMVLKEVLDLEQDPIHHTMMEAIKAFNGAVKHFDAAGAFLTEHEFAIGQEMVKTFFDSYADLNSWALTKGRKLFHITHQFHSVLHLFRNTRF